MWPNRYSRRIESDYEFSLKTASIGYLEKTKGSRRKFLTRKVFKSFAADNFHIEFKLTTFSNQ